MMMTYPLGNIKVDPEKKEEEQRGRIIRQLLHAQICVCTLPEKAQSCFYRIENFFPF